MKEVREPRKAIINAMPIYTMAHTNPALTHAISSLSRREIEVATKLLEGLPNKKIAVEVFISERTVKFHCANIYKKLNINSRTALIAACFKTFYQLGEA